MKGRSHIPHNHISDKAGQNKKVEYENVTEYDLTVAGSTWFQVESTVEYGFGKALPGGQYSANVVAECIAK